MQEARSEPSGPALRAAQAAAAAWHPPRPPTAHGFPARAPRSATIRKRAGRLRTLEVWPGGRVHVEREQVLARQAVHPGLPAQRRAGADQPLPGLEVRAAGRLLRGRRGRGGQQGRQRSGGRGSRTRARAVVARCGRERCPATVQRLFQQFQQQPTGSARPAFATPLLATRPQGPLGSPADLRQGQPLVRQHAHRTLQPQPPRLLVRELGLGEEQQGHAGYSQSLWGEGAGSGDRDREVVGGGEWGRLLTSGGAAGTAPRWKGMQGRAAHTGCVQHATLQQSPPHVAARRVGAVEALEQLIAPALAAVAALPAKDVITDHVRMMGGGLPPAWKGASVSRTGHNC